MAEAILFNSLLPTPLSLPRVCIYILKREGGILYVPREKKKNNWIPCDAMKVFHFNFERSKDENSVS